MEMKYGKYMENMEKLREMENIQMLQTSLRVTIYMELYEKT